MISLPLIYAIALYEFKTLLRSWFFRIFSLLAIVIIIFLDYFLLVFERFPTWMFRGIPSSIPYMNTVLLNVFQAVIAVFLASDFLKNDKKLNSTGALYSRSMTNADYVLGKSLGIFIIFLCLNIVILLIALVFNVFFADVPVVPASYFYYPALISLPTLLFICGLSFFLYGTHQEPGSYCCHTAGLHCQYDFLPGKYISSPV